MKITGIVAAVLAVISFACAVAFGLRSDRLIEDFLASDGAVEKFTARIDTDSETDSQLSPLVKQAQSLAVRINPPAPKSSKKSTAAKRRTTRPRPPKVSAKFKLIGTCLYPSRPQRSLALLDEPGKGLRWVRQSGKVGHIIVEEVKDGLIIVRDGQRTYELIADRLAKKSLLKEKPEAVEKEPEAGPSARPGPRQPAEAASTTPTKTVAQRKVVKPPPSPAAQKKELEKGMEFLKLLMAEPNSMGISEREANDLGDLGQFLKDLREELTQLEDQNSQSISAPNEPDKK